jgi:putative polyhydroxyalkanoate system protein
MARIHLQREHSLGLKKAKAAAQKVADEMTREFAMTCEWEGATLYFERTGVTGELAVTKSTIEVTAELGFLLSAFKARIEEQIQRNFDAYFS